LLDTCNLWDTAFPDIFKLAHEADPTAQLCINDLGLIEAGNAPKLMRIIKEHLWAHDAPIHCIGIQVRRADRNSQQCSMAWLLAAAMSPCHTASRVHDGNCSVWASDGK
jgi:GH35 family endo-1,4-beta-xylanase